MEAVSPVRVREFKDHRGRSWVELCGLDGIPEHDRPPALICEQMAVVNREHLDDSPNRRPIKQRHPGRNIEELKGIHSGPVAILHNGPSLADHDLWQIKVPTIGMNRTHQGYVGVMGDGYKGPQPTYYCFYDHPWGRKETVLAHPRVINGSSMETDPSGGKFWRATASYRMFPFSFDLWRDGFAPPVPCTTGFLAMQLAVYMGFTELFLLGLDLGGGHFDGTKASASMPDAASHYEKVAPYLKNAGIKTWLCGSPGSLLTKVFPQVPFSALLEAV